jgi:hypothetical protein
MVRTQTDNIFATIGNMLLGVFKFTLILIAIILNFNSYSRLNERKLKKQGFCDSFSNYEIG